MASGRGLPHYPWPETLPVASRRSGRQRARHPRAEPTRTAKTAKRFFRKLLKGVQYVPCVIITDKLKSYGAAKREILPGVEHRQHKHLGHPSRELASTHATARKEDAAVQISKTGTTLSLRFWSSRWAFPTTTTPYERAGLSGHFPGPLADVG